MFKYTAHDPESALSVLAASFRLYCASFLYTIVLSLVSAMTFLATNFYVMNHLDMSNYYYSILPGPISSMLGLIFFIPLIKRIYSVGAQLPISTRLAFSGFFKHFVRLVLLIALAMTAGMFLPVVLMIINPELSPGWMVSLFCLMLIVYVYIILKFYFTALFIVLENKSVLEALKASLKIEHNHMWLTFCVLALYYFGYQMVISFTSGFFTWEPLGINLYLLLLSVLVLPLFLSIQICQFFNLKRLSSREAAPSSP
jgi:hypothetical protein